MTTHLRFHLDDRGVSRALLDLWIPAVDPDVIWIIGGNLPSYEMERDCVPFVELSALDVAGVAAEAGEDVQVLAVFCSLEALHQAAVLGLPPNKVTISHLGNEAQDHRVAASVHVDADELAALKSLEERLWTFEIQNLPNVTPRPWKPSDESDAEG